MSAGTIELPNGRKADIDLGDGHYLAWIGKSDHSGKRVGGIVYHRADSETGWCSCAVWWEAPYEPFDRVYWTIQGDPNETLTIAPSVGCGQCPDHGFIRNGKWVRA